MKNLCIVGLVFSIAVFTGCLSIGGSSSKGTVSYYELPNPYVVDDEKERTIAVYTPPGYEESDQRYPLMILISHFASGDHTAFLGEGYPELGILAGEIEIQRVCDALIAEGRMRPAIIALPDYEHGFGENSQFYHDYIAKTVIDSLRSKYRISESREDVVLAGHFWSGRDVIEIAMANQNLFATVVAYSPCLSYAIPSLIKRDYDPNQPVRFYFYQTNFKINYGNGACDDAFARKHAEVYRNLDIEVYEEEYDSDQFSTLLNQIVHSLVAVF